MKKDSKLPRKKGAVLVYIIVLLALALYAFENAVNLNPLYPDGAFFWCVTITAFTAVWCFFRLGGALRGAISAKVDEQGRPVLDLGGLSFKKIPKVARIILIVPWALLIGVSIYSVVLFHPNVYRDQLGEPRVETFSSDVQAVDLSQIPIVDRALALKLADKKLGERASLGSQVVLGEPTIQRQNDRLIWAVPLHHSGLFKWLTNLSGTPGYIIVSATNVNDVEYVEGHRIKYQPDLFLMHDLARHVRYTVAPLTGITDYSFEIDEEGVPHWIVTTYENRLGFALPEATGVLAVNASTGQATRYAISEMPEWIDRAQPADFIRRQIANQGEYVHGVFNFSDKDKFRPSGGQVIVYNKGRCYLFTGLTSVGNDESAIGFMMVDMVTKETLLYRMNGATEAAAQGSAQGKVQHLGYYASDPLIINADGVPTYFMTLKDREGLIKQYALVSVANYSTVGVGDTVAQAYRNYQAALRQDGLGGALSPEAGEQQAVQGTVERISGQFDGNHTVYYLILKEQANRIYTIESTLSSELALTQPGDRVKLTWYGAPEQPIRSAAEFDNLAFRQD